MCTDDQTRWEQPGKVRCPQRSDLLSEETRQNFIYISIYKTEKPYVINNQMCKYSMAKNKAFLLGWGLQESLMEELWD